MKDLYNNTICIILLSFLSSEMFPENSSIVNYTQVFFRWDQIPDAENYQFIIDDITNNVQYEKNTQKNSILIDDFLNWDSNYIWYVCAQLTANDSILCSNTYTLSINSLPDYFPDEIIVQNYNDELIQEGITMMDIESLKFSTSLDKNGAPIWFVDRNNFRERFTYTQFLNNGNIIGFGSGQGYEINLDGDIVFETNENTYIHHDFNKTKHGTYFFISATIEDHYCPDECNPLLPDTIPWQGDIFKEIDDSGNELWSWNTFDNINLSEYNPYYIEIYTGSYEMDWTHSNAIFFDQNSSSVLVSIRNLSRISKIDYATGELIWHLGETDFMNEIYFNENLNFSQQHSVKVLDNGNILFFDNHRYLNPELSRCVEFSFNEIELTSEIVWEHILPANLFTGSRGDCNRLENGNTLITTGRTGNIIEVNTDNQVVWQLDINNLNNNTTMYRSNRYPHLYPIAFSIQINNLSDKLNETIVEPINDTITFTINNFGWSSQDYTYKLFNQTEQLINSGNITLETSTDYILKIDASNLPIGDYSFKIYPIKNINKQQTLNFYLNFNSNFGDLNQDGNVNILDIIIISNIILDSTNNKNADLNQDNFVNILDIIVLVNLILET